MKALNKEQVQAVRGLINLRIKYTLMVTAKISPKLINETRGKIEILENQLGFDLADEEETSTEGMDHIFKEDPEPPPMTEEQKKQMKVSAWAMDILKNGEW